MAVLLKDLMNTTGHKCKEKWRWRKVRILPLKDLWEKGSPVMKIEMLKWWVFDPGSIDQVLVGNIAVAFKVSIFQFSWFPISKQYPMIKPFLLKLFVASISIWLKGKKFHIDMAVQYISIRYNIDMIHGAKMQKLSCCNCSNWQFIYRTGSFPYSRAAGVGRCPENESRLFRRRKSCLTTQH